MGQTSYIYILWLVILAAGLWIVVGYGSLIHAQEDLAGEWELTPEEPVIGVQARHMKVEQSGRYFNITFADGKPLPMKLIDDRIVEEHFGQRKRITLTGQGTTVTFEGRCRGDLWRLSLAGPVCCDYVARLTERTYPRPGPATRSASASLGYAR